MSLISRPLGSAITVGRLAIPSASLHNLSRTYAPTSSAASHQAATHTQHLQQSQQLTDSKTRRNFGTSANSSVGSTSSIRKSPTSTMLKITTSRGRKNDPTLGPLGSQMLEKLKNEYYGGTPSGSDHSDGGDANADANADANGDTHNTAPSVSLFISLTDDSWKHAGHAGVKEMAEQNPETGELIIPKETHFRLKIVSDKFEGKNRVKRQREVMALFKQEFGETLHALELVCRTKGEEEKVGGE